MSRKFRRKVRKSIKKHVGQEVSHAKQEVNNTQSKLKELRSSLEYEKKIAQEIGQKKYKNEIFPTLHGEKFRLSELAKHVHGLKLNNASQSKQSDSNRANALKAILKDEETINMLVKYCEVNNLNTKKLYITDLYQILDKEEFECKNKNFDQSKFLPKFKKSLKQKLGIKNEDEKQENKNNNNALQKNQESLKELVTKYQLESQNKNIHLQRVLKKELFDKILVLQDPNTDNKLSQLDENLQVEFSEYQVQKLMNNFVK